jgi:hypothetical protein
MDRDPKPQADVHQGARVNRRHDAEYMAAPDQSPKTTNPLATREPSIQGPRTMPREILRKASAYFAQAELDRRFKP